MGRRLPGSVTAADLRVLEVVRSRVTDTGLSPTLREIAAAMGTSLGVAQRHVNALLSARQLLRGGLGPRSLVLPGRPVEGGQAPVPLVVRLAKDTLLAAENLDGYVGQPSPLPAGVFAIRVGDDGLRNSGIVHGAIAYVQPTMTTSRGLDLVAAVINGTLVVRHLRTSRRAMELIDDTGGVVPMKAAGVRLLGAVFGWWTDAP